MPEKTVEKINLQTVFVYVTERCNLKCTYCYFKHKKGRDIDLSTVGAFLANLSQAGLIPRRFEISGGEPLLCWDKVKALVHQIEQYYPAQSIGLQTNGLLLTKDKVGFLRKHGIALEIGIDGDVEVTTRWRKPMGKGEYGRLVSNICMGLKEGVSVACNMTVHPSDSVRLVRNCIALHALGVRSIDITPAAFMRWGARAIETFQEQYIELMKLVEIKSTLYTQEDTRFITEPFLDMSFHPPGYVLCGDAYLCLSDREREQHSLWDCWNGKLRPESVRFFFKAYAAEKKKLRRQAYTHRDYVCASFQIVNDLVGKKYLNTVEIIPLMLFLTRMHLSS